MKLRSPHETHITLAQQENLKQSITFQLTELQNIILDLSSSQRMCKKKIYDPKKQSNFSKPQESQLLNHIQMIIQKAKMQIIKHQQALQKISSKIMKPMAIQIMKNCLEDDYLMIIKQINILNSDIQNFSLGVGHISMNRGTIGAKNLRSLQRELGDEWNKLSDQVIENQQRSSIEIDKDKPLQLIAMQQLQKQFLTIRMIAYKMYENYIGHSHQNIEQELKTTKQEQQKLKKQIIAAKQIKIGLEAEEKQLARQLKQLKNCNQIIGRRHFIMDDNI